MKKIFLLIILIFVSLSFVNAQTTTPINADRMAVFTVPSEGDVADTLLPYYADLGVRRVIVADADGNGDQEILATDYSNGGRVHVMEVAQDSTLEIIWSSPVDESSSGSTPRFIQVGDCDGDGNMEIIFEQNGFANIDGTVGRIVIYEWDGVSSWGDAPAFWISSAKIAAMGGTEGLRLTREVLTVFDFDGDGKTEIIPHGVDDPRGDVLIIGITGQFSSGSPGFSSPVLKGGDPSKVSNGGQFVGGSFWNAFPADINGDGDLEIINHNWNNYAFWSIDIDPSLDVPYVFPEVTDNADAKAKGAYQTYTDVDAVSYFGAQAVDVDGDGKDEIVGTQYGNSHNVGMISFPETVDEIYAWTEASKTENYAEIVQSSDIAALAGKDASSFWPIVKGDLNQDGKDEMYTGGGTGLNLVAIQYKGEGELLDPESYDMNLIYNGAGGEVFAEWEIRNGRATYRSDTLYAGTDSMEVTETPIGFDPSVIDTIKTELPFTAYIFADNVDLDNDGKLEVVLAEQSVYDSVSVNVFDWIDTSGIGQWILNLDDSYKVFNDYRQTVRVLEYNGSITGLEENIYGIVTPDDYKLDQNYPNPFNPSTAINFSLPLDKKISLKVFNMIGQEVRTLVDSKDLKKGNHQITWDGTNNFGSKVASGNYIVKLTFGNFAKSIKMTLLK